MRRTTEFIPLRGLSVTLASLRKSGEWGSTHLHPGLTVTLVSQDPAINPIPTPNPFEFTIPGRRTAAA